MPDLSFKILSAEIMPYAVAPTVVFNLQISNAVADEEVYAVGLKSQIRIEAVHRQYDDAAKKRLLEVFGEPERWGETLKSLYWKTVTIPVPRFIGQTVVQVPLECSEDMSAAVGKYLYSVADGEVPLAFVFNGSIFYKGDEEKIQVTQLPWDKEASFRMPISIWDNLMEAYFPDSKWLRIPNDIFDKLYLYKAKSAYPTINRCLESLVDEGLAKVQKIEKDHYE